jgi:hypothetical protein
MLRITIVLIVVTTTSYAAVQMYPAGSVVKVCGRIASLDEATQPEVIIVAGQVCNAPPVSGNPFAVVLNCKAGDLSFEDAVHGAMADDFNILKKELAQERRSVQGLAQQVDELRQKVDNQAPWGIEFQSTRSISKLYT